MEPINFAMAHPTTMTYPNVGGMTTDIPTFKSYTDLVVFLLQIRTRAKLMHWSTYKFSTHLALGEFYDELETLTDEMAEMMMGSEETLDFTSTKVDDITLPTQPCEFMSCVRDAVLTAGGLFDHDPGLKNKFDEIIGLVNRTKYKIERLVS